MSPLGMIYVHRNSCSILTMMQTITQKGKRPIIIITNEILSIGNLLNNIRQNKKLHDLALHHTDTKIYRTENDIKYTFMCQLLKRTKELKFGTK